MGEPMTEERLKEIEARAEIARRPPLKYATVYQSAEDVPALVAEVRRLRGAAVEIRKHVNGQCQCASTVVCLDEIDTLTMPCGAPPKPEGT